MNKVISIILEQLIIVNTLQFIVLRMMYRIQNNYSCLFTSGSMKFQSESFRYIFVHFITQSHIQANVEEKYQ